MGFHAAVEPTHTKNISGKARGRKRIPCPLYRADGTMLKQVFALILAWLAIVPAAADEAQMVISTGNTSPISGTW